MNVRRDYSIIILNPKRGIIIGKATAKILFMGIRKNSALFVQEQTTQPLPFQTDPFSVVLVPVY